MIVFYEISVLQGGLQNVLELRLWEMYVTLESWISTQT